MGELHQALGDISSIRRQMARATEFRGYGPATLAATGILAAFAATAQALWLPNPSLHVAQYLGLWIATACTGTALAGIQMYTRTQRIHSGLSSEMLRTAVEQFLPAVIAGMLLTLVIVRSVPSAVWMLPGLWQVIYSLGVLASCRFLPNAMIVAGVWYLLTGLICLSAGEARALAPWTMGLPYGIGQLLVASILATSTPEAHHAR